MTKQIDQLVEETLKKEPEFQLPVSFRDRVIQKIRRKEKASQRRLYIFLSLGVLLMLTAGFGLLKFFGAAAELGQFGNIVPVATLVGILVVTIQYLDKTLVKDRYFKQLA